MSEGTLQNTALPSFIMAIDFALAFDYINSFDLAMAMDYTKAFHFALAFD